MQDADKKNDDIIQNFCNQVDENDSDKRSKHKRIIILFILSPVIAIALAFLSKLIANLIIAGFSS